MRARRPLVVAVVAVAVGVVLWLGVLRGRGENGRLRASGTVEATEARLGFPVPGRLVDVAVREGDAVRAGAELARLDRDEAAARREQAAAQAAAAQAQLEEVERGFRSEEIAQARAARDAAEQRRLDAERDLQRTRNLFEAGAVSQEAYDKAQLARDVATSQATAAREQCRLVETGQRPERIAAQRALVAQAQAAVQASDAALDNLTLRAPFDGVVTVRHREPGETVPTGSPVLTVMDPGDRWVRIYVAETRIGAVRLGQPVAISCDTYPRKTYAGEVSFIASEAEFTPKTVQTTEERVKLVYAVKVRITGDPELDLKPGMPADATLAPALP